MLGDEQRTIMSDPAPGEGQDPVADVPAEAEPEAEPEAGMGTLISSVNSIAVPIPCNTVFFGGARVWTLPPFLQTRCFVAVFLVAAARCVAK